MQDKVIDIPRLRNIHRVYRDRSHGGEVLAGLLNNSTDRPDGIVLAIPSGGVPVAIPIADKLAMPMDLLITRKLQIPGNTEAGFGAVTMDGKAFFNDELLARLHLSPAEIEREIKKVSRELYRRNRIFRNNRPMPDLRNRTVIIADDGLASGYTMMAAIGMVKAHAPKKVIIAVPTAPLSSILRVENQADKIVCPNIQDYGSFAVAAAYEIWRDLDAGEVMEMLSATDRFYR